MSDKRPRVIIIGSGFGGIYAAKHLQNADVDITLIAATTHHLFQPLLYQAATGILSEGEIAPLNRLVLRNQKNIDVVLGTVTDINISNKKVIAELEDNVQEYSYDYLIVAAGSNQSYFGNDHYAQYAPGLKSLDDALEIRARIVSAFERAEAEPDLAKKRKLLTFVVVGAGPTGVEVAGQIAELAHYTLKGAYSTFAPHDAQIILLDAAPKVLPPFSDKSGKTAQKNLTKMGVDIRLSAKVTDLDEDSITVEYKDGSTHTIDAYFKIWSAGVAASPLGKIVADQTGTETDKAGRVRVLPDLTLKNTPEVFVIGDMASIDGVPGQCPGAIQGAKYAAGAIIRSAQGESPKDRKPFKYFDKGTMATVARYKAVAEFRKFKFSGYPAWAAWLVVHLYYLVGFKNRAFTIASWFITFITNKRGQLSSTSLQVHARNYQDTVIEKKK